MRSFCLLKINFNQMKVKTSSLITAMIFLAFSYTMAQKTLADATKGKFLLGVAVSMQQINGNNPIESVLISLLE